MRNLHTRIGKDQRLAMMPLELRGEKVKELRVKLKVKKSLLKELILICFEK